MSALEIAEHHLTEALSRLEHALAQRLAAADPDQAAAIIRITDERNALSSDMETLRDECRRLRAALQAAERDRDAMRKVTDEVAERLDSSIEVLDRVIEE